MKTTKHVLTCQTHDRMPPLDVEITIDSSSVGIKIVDPNGIDWAEAYIEYYDKQIRGYLWNENSNGNDPSAYDVLIKDPITVPEAE